MNLCLKRKLFNLNIGYFLSHVDLYFLIFTFHPVCVMCMVLCNVHNIPSAKIIGTTQIVFAIDLYHFISLYLFNICISLLLFFIIIFIRLLLPMLLFLFTIALVLYIAIRLSIFLLLDFHSLIFFLFCFISVSFKDICSFSLWLFFYWSPCVYTRRLVCEYIVKEYTIKSFLNVNTNQFPV